MLVNNAGVIQVGPIEVMTIEDYEEAMRTHFWAALTTLSCAGNASGAGAHRQHLVIGGISVPHLAPYSASNLRWSVYQKACAGVKEDGVVVTTVCPGLMRTGSPRNATFKGSTGPNIMVQHQRRAARQCDEGGARRTQIIAACKRGDAEVILSIQAGWSLDPRTSFPGVTADARHWLLSAARSSGIGKRRAKGKRQSIGVVAVRFDSLERAGCGAE